eukprot:GSChrysophyteH2.ASY1.ANO1.1362.1 assembled CDS
MWQLVVVVVALLSVLKGAEAACANGCSGHGTCGQNNICTCFTGWDAGAADCSFRSCPTGPAWADKAYATDSAHLPATCSNAGICDNSSGQCKCFTGFTGSACQRSKCPNDCNGHGTCVSIADMSYYYGADYIQDGTAASGDGVGIVYTNWDKDSITMCECDASYFGADCSLHMCAKGDDPLTINQNYHLENTNVREWAYCSNRGTCDFGSGQCTCNTGYGGASCSNSTYFHGTGVNAAPGLQILADGADYQGDVLQVRTSKSASADFNLIEAIANNQRMFFVRGDGTVGFTSLITPGGATISSGGLVVATTGATITDGGLVVTDGGATINSQVSNSEKNALKVKCASSSAASDFTVMDIQTDTSSNHFLMSAKDSTGTDVYNIRSSGRVDIHKGGLSVTGGVSIRDSGLSVTGGMTLETGGLEVNQGITVATGALSADGGVHVRAGGLLLTGIHIETRGVSRRHVEK